MADINFDCAFCQQNLDAPEDMTGMSIECPACGKSLRIPAPTEMHYPIKKPLAPQSTATPKNMPPKDSDKPSGVSGEAPDSEEVKTKTAKIVLPPEANLPIPRHSRIIVIKRPGK